MLTFLAVMCGGCGALRCAGLFRGPPVPPAQTGLPDEPMVLTTKWLVQGNWTAVTVDSNTRPASLYATFDRGMTEGVWSDIWMISGDGRLVSKTELRPPYPLGSWGGLRLSLYRPRDSDSPAFIRWGNWIESVSTFDLSGRQLWVSRLPSGVDDIEVADLDTDGSDEVIVGLNGQGGIEVLDANGTCRWRSHVVCNVWSVAAVPSAERSEKLEVVALGSPAHAAALFTADGSLNRSLGPVRSQEEPYRLRAATARESQRVIVCAYDSKPLSITALDLDQGQLWSILDERSGSSGITDLATADHAPYAAVAMRDGGVIVYDLNNGRRLASVWAGGYQHPVWLPSADGSPPLLVLVTGQGLQAFELAARAQQATADGRDGIRVEGRFD